MELDDANAIMLNMRKLLSRPMFLPRPSRINRAIQFYFWPPDLKMRQKREKGDLLGAAGGNVQVNVNSGRGRECSVSGPITKHQQSRWERAAAR